MTALKRFFSILALLVVAGCGGGGGSAGCPVNNLNCGTTTPPPGTTAVTDLDVKLSANTIPNSGAGAVTATVTALDANRNAVAGAAVAVSSDSGLITVGGTAGSVTDATGKLLATVTLGSNLTLRTIVVTATSGTIKRTANLQVVDSPAGAVPTTIEVIAGATTVGTGGDGVVIRGFVKDANNNALPSTAISFRTNTGTLTNVSAVTDASGAGSATFSSGADKSNREATITVTSGAISKDIKLPISGTKLTLSGPSSMILGTTAAFDIVVTDSNSNVAPNVVIVGTSALNNPLSAAAGTTTNASGQVRFTYVANNAGTDNLVFSGAGSTVAPSPQLVVSGEDFAFVSPAPGITVDVNVAQAVQVRLRSGGVAQANRTINFAATGGTLSATSAITDANGIASVTLTSASAGPVTVQANVANTSTSATLPLVIVATLPSKLVLQVNPTAIAPNTGASTTNQAQVVAKVTDTAGNPVQGKTVNFTREVDPSGGNLLQASATTDPNGQATVTYRSGAESTASNGVVLRATVAGTVVTDTAVLTVNQTALFIALGTGNVITNLDPQTYKKDWVVYVTDSNGIPVNGVTLTIKAIPTRYLTGQLAYNGAVWTYSAPIWQCRNEDANTNGILDPGEDDNGDGVLWPGNVISVTPGSVQTINGRATISLIYAESYAPWVQLKLTASATVSGTESKTDVEFIVAGAAEDFGSATNPPAGVVSPFGRLPKPGTAAGACATFP